VGSAGVEAGAEIAAGNRIWEVLGMSGTTNVVGAGGESRRAILTMASGETPVATRRISAADKLMAAPSGIVLPCLSGVLTEQRFSADDKEVVALAEILVNFDIAVPGDWERSDRDATKCLLLTLERWIRMHGGPVIDRRFALDLALSDRLVDYSDERGPDGTLYLVLDPDSAAFVLLTPTIELLENVHPRLPATFYNHFAGALSRWVRVYDYHDAEERVEMLREWYEGEENADQYEVPDVEGCTPKSLKETPLNLCELKKLNAEIRDARFKALITGLLELCRVSKQAKRPEFTEDMGEQLMDSNPALPCLLAAFSTGDAVVGCFDDEAQTAMEVTPQPNVIIPLRLCDPASIRKGFRTLGIVCETLAAASRLIDLMPGNEEGVITREG
jgi:hypothetical protein